MLSILSLLVDFGLVVLTWLVQCIIYPSFSRVDIQQFNQWHTTYTKRITLIVAPLMLAQFFIAIYWLIVSNMDWVTVSYFLLVVLTWVITFLRAVPLHGALDAENKERMIPKLIRVNAWRSVIWTLVFVFHLVNFPLSAHLIVWRYFSFSPV
ncbi:MAG: hypothetical protein KTR13_00920 [Saprospiraceae bacterium]|nr:hypothetical protein [Saprospiraceae bacterium]